MNITAVLKNIREYTVIFSKGHIWIIPIDLISHVFLSFLITKFLDYKKVKTKNIFIILLLLSLFKEFIDSFSLESPFNEHVKDLVYSMLYPSWIVLFRWVREKLD